MFVEPVNLTLANRDLYLIQIQAQIAAKRKYLIEKQRKLKEEAKHNEFLEVVKNDYKKYYDYIITQKKRELQTFDTLKQYLNDVSKSNNLSEKEIQTTRKEQKSILAEIDGIKKQIDDMIEITDVNLNKSNKL